MFDKNVDINLVSRTTQKIYHFEKMEIGDSQEICVIGRKRQTLSKLVSDYGKRYGMTFTIRKVAPDHVRVWRVA